MPEDTLINDLNDTCFCSFKLNFAVVLTLEDKHNIHTLSENI